jgi:hypothetical protein
MSSKRSAVKTSECENVSKSKSKLNAGYSSRDLIREVQSLHYTTVKRSMQGPYVGTDDKFSFGLPKCQSNCTKFNFYLIKCTLAILHSIYLICINKDAVFTFVFFVPELYLCPF